MSATTIPHRLLQIPICKGLSEAEIKSVLAIADETSADAGAQLFTEGERGECLYVVLEGTVEVLKRDRAGQQQQLAVVGDGSVLGEMTLLNAHSARSASARAKSPVKLLRIPSDRFGALLKQDSTAALKIVHNLAQVLSRRLLLMDEKLVDLMNPSKKKEELVDFQRILNNWAY